jgi:hypothetical protein
MNENEMNDFLVEGRNDNENNRPAQRRRIAGHRDGVSRQVVDISADHNDPVSRFADIRRGFDSVTMLSDSLRYSWADRNAPLPEHRRTQRDIANEFQQANTNYTSAVLSEDERAIRFWNTVCANLDAELAAISSNTVDSNEESSSNNND